MQLRSEFTPEQAEAEELELELQIQAHLESHTHLSTRETSKKQRLFGGEQKEDLQ